MTQQISIDKNSATFDQALNTIKNKINKIQLAEEDLLLLACAEIARSFTRDEKDYTN